MEFSITEFGAVTTDLYRITATDGRRQWTFSGSDVGSGVTGVNTATTGTLAVTFRLLVDAERHVAEGSFELELQPDWFWTVNFWPLDRDPTTDCLGCLRHFVFPLPAELRSSEADSMHVVVGGNYISDPVVY